MMSEEPALDFYTTVDDEMYEDLAELAGQRVVHVQLWEESISDMLEGQEVAATSTNAADLDLYLEGGIYFELYGVLAYRNPEQDPLPDRETVARQLTALVKQGLWLDEVAVDEEDGLVLILSRARKPQLYLSISGWSVDEWDELPAG